MKLSKKPKVSRVLRTKGLKDLVNDPEVSELIEKGDHVGLINHPKMQIIASDPEVNKLLDGLAVEKMIDESTVKRLMQYFKFTENFKFGIFKNISAIFN